MSYLDKYISLIGGVDKTERQQLIEDEIEAFNEYMENAPNRYIGQNIKTGQEVKITLQDVGFNDQRFGDEKLLCANIDQDLKIGDVVSANNQNWLLIFKENNTINSHLSFICRPINYILKFNDSQNNIHQYPCITVDTTMYSLGSENTKFYEQGDAKLQITITNDENTRKLVEKTRLIVDDRAWSVARVSKLQKGLIQLTCGQSTFDYDRDDIPSEIPYNNWEKLNQNTYENIDTPSTDDLVIDIQGDDNIIKDLYNEWIGLVYENGVQVDKGIIWEIVSNSELVNEVRQENNKIALQNISGDIDDTFTIRCKLVEDNLIYCDKTVKITRM